MKRNAYKFLIIATIIALGLAGCSAEAKVERQLELGASSMEAGDYDAAIEAYEEVIALDKYEIEGYEGLVAAMVADGRSSEEIEGVVASATDVITELKESEGGLSEEDKAAAERLYINAANAVADDKDAQAAILENGAGVLEESSAIKEAYKEVADENTDEINEDAQDSTETTAEDSSNENAGDGSNENGQDALVMETEFGYISCLGANAEYPDVFEDFEIEINGQVILVSLPKGMCTHYNWYAEDNALSLQNADGSKWMYIFHTDFTQTEEGKEKTLNYDAELFKSSLGYHGFTDFPDDAELVTLRADENLIINYIPCNVDSYYGNVLEYNTYRGKKDDWYEGTFFIVYYGEISENYSDCDFIVESFANKTFEDVLNQ